MSYKSVYDMQRALCTSMNQIYLAELSPHGQAKNIKTGESSVPTFLYLEKTSSSLRGKTIAILADGVADNQFSV